jgi:hypothetical protein
MPTEDLLSPVHLVELGRRITKETAEQVGVLELIEDARLVVQRGLRSLVAAAVPLGLTERQIQIAAFREPPYNQYGWATKDPRLSPQSWAGHELPPARTVLYGKKKLPAAVAQYAFMYRDDAAVLLFEGTEWGHASLSSLTQAADYHGDMLAFWTKLGRYEVGSRLLA